ncbi:hypothetical protein SAMN04487914_11399 [Arthrobacter sp. ok909]|uniref:hypothetical protein n=1 Tax=Arthrobacter sp. ok909 TaxID=1761746 RepID=UPI0008823F10|nr:hypothetical protein [Arthrobacter sp. ok909]SDP49947.1 hypothetical protein SAMN04487914_11399 [Arthrobacter sp. ok909]
MVALGATVAETTRAFTAIEGTFLSTAVGADGNTVWRFHHPTIREGFAASVARDISTLSVYLEGMTTDELVSGLDCGGPNQRGTLVQVPPTMYSLVAPRVPVPDGRELSGSPRAWFLRTRCSDEFLRLWAEAHADALAGMADFGMMVEAVWQPGVLSRLQQAGALPENVRREAVERIVEYSIDGLDPAWANSDLKGLFVPEEYADLIRRIEEEVLPNLEDRIDEHVSSIISSMTKEELYQTPRDYVEAIRQAFDGRHDIFMRCNDIDQHISERAYSDEEEDESWAQSSGLAAPARGSTSTEAGSLRDPFEDVAAGH